MLTCFTECPFDLIGLGGDRDLDKEGDRCLAGATSPRRLPRERLLLLDNDLERLRGVRLRLLLGDRL